MSDKIHSDRRRRWPAVVGMILFAVLLLLLAVAGAHCSRVLRLGQLMNTAAASRKWPTVEGRILSSGIRESRVSGKSRSTREFEFMLNYDYTVNSRSYSGSRIYFGYSPEAEKEPAYDLAGDYPSGKTVVVHYHPAHPAESTLETGQSLNLRQQYHRAKILLWADAAALVIAGTITVLAWRRWRQPRNQS
jgi:hypothetical protein